MNEQRDRDLVDELLGYDSELTWLEFKTKNSDPKLIGKLCSALSNSARMDGQDFGYVLWGVDDDNHQIVGTQFDPNNKKVDNQVFQIWLAQQLRPSVPFNFKVINHPKGRVVLLEIPAAISAPVTFNGIGYFRMGSGTPKLVDYPLCQHSCRL